MDKQYVKNQSVPLPILFRLTFIFDFLMCLFYLVMIIMLQFDRFIEEEPAIAFFNRSALHMWFVYALVFFGITANAGLMRGFPRTLPLGYINWLLTVLFTLGYFQGYDDFWHKIPDVVPPARYITDMPIWQLISMRSGFCMLYLMSLFQLRFSYMVNFKHQEGMAEKEESKETMGGMGTIGRNFYMQQHQDELTQAVQKASAAEEKAKTSSGGGFLKFLIITFIILGLVVAGIYFLSPITWQKIVGTIQRQIVLMKESRDQPFRFTPPDEVKPPVPDVPTNPPPPPNAPQQAIVKPTFPSNAKIQEYEKALTKSIQLPKVKNPTLLPTIRNICQQTGVPMLKNPQIVDQPIQLQLSSAVPANNLLQILLPSKQLDYVVCPRGLYIISGASSNVDWKKLEVMK